MDNKITYHSPSRGSSMEMGAAIVVLLFSQYSLPVSTSMCITGATVGVAASLCCAGAALGMTLYRRDRLSPLHRTAVGASFVAACVLNGMLLILVVGSAV